MWLHVYIHNLCGCCEFMYFIDFPFWDSLCLFYSCYSVLTNFFGGMILARRSLQVLVDEEYLKKLHPCSRWGIYFLDFFFDFLCNSLDSLSYYSLNYWLLILFVCLFYLFSFQPTNGGRCKLFYIFSWFISWVLSVLIFSLHMLVIHLMFKCYGSTSTIL